MISLKKYLLATLLLAIFSTARSEEPLLRSGKDVTEERPAKEQVNPFGEYDPNDPFARIDQQRLSEQQQEAGEPIEAKGEDSEKGVGVSVPILKEPTGTSLNTPGKIEVKRGFGAIIDAIKSIFKSLGIGTLKNALAPLNDILDTISARGTADATKLSSSDLLAIQDELGNLSKVINSSARTYYSDALRAELNNLAEEVYGPGITIEDLAPADTHLNNTIRALDWMKKPADLAGQAIERGNISPKDQVFLDVNQQTTLSLSEATRQISPLIEEVNEANSPVVASRIENALNYLGRAVDNVDSVIAISTTQTAPELRIVEYQDAYATLVTARTLFSAVASRPIEPQLKARVLDLLDKAKTNFSKVSSITKDLKIPTIENV